MQLKDSLYELFCEATGRFSAKPFLAIPGRLTGQWGVPSEISFGETLARVEQLKSQYMQKGIREGDRVALAFESRPEFVFHYLALNGLGACVVPLNTDLTANELSYQLLHADCGVVIGLPSLREQLAQVIGATGRPIPLSTSGPQEIENIWRPASGLVLPSEISRPAAILYTSGTTGKPKGCMLDNTYLQESAAYNTRLPEQLAYGIGSERMMNPLPLYHINAMVNTLGCAIITGSCYVMPGRFSATNWWNDLIDTRATRFKYLGIMIPALLAQPETARDRDIGIKYAFGAGVDPTLHERFEARFGIRLMEVWGMTETGRSFMVDGEPRYIDTRACGRPRQGLEARIVNEAGEELPDGEVGELVVRHNALNPRYGFFSGYLHDPEATEAAWEGGWFHTGDLCRRSADGMYFFVDRKKNIIRRSGENISSAEVESVLAACPLVRQAVVMAVPDALRDEEVLACVVPAQGAEAGLALASSIHAFAAEQLAYYKTPGWIKFLDELPLTGTQKVQKHRIFPGGFSPDSSELHDLRGSKRWQK